MEESAFMELSNTVQVELSTFNDTKAPVSLEGVDVLIQTICDGFTRIPSVDQPNDAIRRLESKNSISVINHSW